MLKKDCQYCLNREAIEAFGRVALETDTSLIIVFKDQSHKGRLVVAYKKDHVAEIADLSKGELDLFMNDVIHAVKLIRTLFKPDRVNYGAFSDTLGHLHMHLVPKYEGGFEWGGTFKMNTNNYASDEEINALCKLVKENW